MAPRRRCSIDWRIVSTVESRPECNRSSSEKKVGTPGNRVDGGPKHPLYPIRGQPTMHKFAHKGS